MNPKSAILGLLLAIPSLLHAQSIETEIRAEVARYVSRVNEGNSRALAELYLVDANASTVRDGKVHRDGQAIAEVVEAAHKQFGKIQLTVDSVTVLPLGGAAAAQGDAPPLGAGRGQHKISARGTP